MRAVFEKSFYERLVDFYTEQSVATGKKIVRILLDDGEWRDFLNDQDVLSKAAPVEFVCNQTNTVREGYRITMPDIRRSKCEIIILQYFEGFKYGT
jgi:hypothetical protein